MRADEIVLSRNWLMSKRRSSSWTCSSSASCSVVAEALMLLTSISSCSRDEIPGNLISRGFQGCLPQSVMWGCFFKSNVVGAQVVRKISVPFDWRQAAKESSRAVMLIGSDSHGLSCAFVPKWRNWFGLKRLWFKFGGCRASGKTRTQFNPVDEVCPVAAATTGTFFTGA